MGHKELRQDSLLQSEYRAQPYCGDQVLEE